MKGLTHAQWGHRLYEARRDRKPIPPITDSEPEFTAVDAYAIQSAFVTEILGEGGKVVGYKLGLTSKPMQDMMGIDQPDYGPVLSSMVFEDGATVKVDEYIQPKVEAEIALVIAETLAGPAVTTEAAGRAIKGAEAAIEMVDSRIEGWKIKLVDTISDLASSAAIILGQDTVSLEGWDVRLCGMVVRRNGTVEATGAGAAALGNPVAAVAWLANTLAPFGVVLQPGHFVMTGALHRAFPVEKGDFVRADFDRLGAVTVEFQ